MSTTITGVQPGQKGNGCLRIAPFRFDVTPPMGHSLCAGWIKPVIGYDDPLEALGFVLLGIGDPIVICAVDWLGISNEAHLAWRKALANAARTSSDRAAVHCVHQHNAPLVCLEAGRLVKVQTDLTPVFDVVFFNECLERAQSAIKTALREPRTVSGVAHGEAEVFQVASNRRVARDKYQMVTEMRRSSCTDPQLIALPEGLIDPLLKTVAFFDGKIKVVSCHYYSTHPMSYYEDGRVSSDFCGLARKRREQEEPGCTHIYFTGCAGNIAAGKYNTGTREARVALTQRVYEGIVSSEMNLVPKPIQQAEWRTREIILEPNSKFNEKELNEVLAGQREGGIRPQHTFGDSHARILAAFKLAWIHRCARRIPIILSSLHLNDISLLHLPAEVFIQYQLRAQQMKSDRFIAIAAYGDDGPFYIPTKEEYRHGGYEVSVAFASDRVDQALTEGIRDLLN